MMQLSFASKKKKVQLQNGAVICQSHIGKKERLLEIL
tara:strand:+ start:19 stop:129 length:111 start_codon:yes stop_codon:yes gene_type:complete